MIVSMHVATGAAGGALAGSRIRAAVLGLVLHGICDRIPHRDIASRTFEIESGLLLLGLLAAARGPFDPAVVGAAAASAPDLEHVLPLPRPGGKKLFPTHRVAGWHRTGGVSTGAQLVAAGVIVGLLVRRPERRGRRRQQRRSCARSGSGGSPGAEPRSGRAEAIRRGEALLAG
jgi:hypothetical protein